MLNAGYTEKGLSIFRIVLALGAGALPERYKKKTKVKTGHELKI